MRDRPPNERRRPPLGAVALVAALAAATVLGACSAEDGTSAEQAKADQLRSALDEAGLDPVERNDIVSLYGTDGGKVCALAEDPGAMAREGLLAHPRFALRKTEVDPDAVAYVTAVVEVYCPDQLAEVEDHIDRLRVDDAS